eukprot:scaffold30204_cov79-Isochrysis_galbana.AAC.1
MKTRDDEPASSTLHTNGTTAMSRPFSYASHTSSLGSRSRMSTGLFRPSVIWPSQEPRFLSSDRSDEEERILGDDSSTRAF